MTIINIPNKKFVNEQLETLSSFLGQRFEDAEDKRNDRSKVFTHGYEYYECLRPSFNDKNDIVGYVSPVVRSVTDRIQPSLMNIFTENEAQAVVFRPQRTMLPKEVVDAVNNKVNDIFLRQNNGYNVLANAFREGLVTGDAFLKVFIEEDVIEEEIDFGEEGVPFEMLAIALQEFPDTDPEKVDIYEQTSVDEFTEEKTKIPFVRGKVTLTRIEQKPRVSFIPFDEIYTIADTQELKDTRYLCHRIKKTVGELIEMGYDKEVVSTVIRSVDGMNLSTKDLSNNEGWSNDDLEDKTVYDPMEKEVHLYEHYIKTSLLDKKGKAKLYQVLAVDVDKILEVNEVLHLPFVHGVPDGIPGAFWGKGLGEIYGEDQVYMTSILRDYAMLSKRKVNPTLVAVKDQYNKQSLLNMNQIGAVVEVNASGAVQAMDFSGNPGEMLGVLQYIQGQVQEGMMNSTGANMDPASMAGMSATAVSISAHNAEMKDKRIAKSFAYTMVRPLFELLYNIIREKALPLEVEGMAPNEMGEMVQQVVPFDSAMLPTRSEFYIDVNTANDDATQVSALSNVAASLVQLGSMPSTVITPQNLFEIGARMLKAADIPNVEAFLTDPSKNTPSPEEQAMAQQQQQMEMQQAMDAREAQLGLQAAQQNLVETQTEELVKMNNWKREVDEKQMLIEMEKLEVARTKEEAKAEQDAIRNGLRAEEMAIEAATGQTIGIS